MVWDRLPRIIIFLICCIDRRIVLLRIIEVLLDIRLVSIADIWLSNCAFDNSLIIIAAIIIIRHSAAAITTAHLLFDQQEDFEWVREDDLSGFCRSMMRFGGRFEIRFVWREACVKKRLKDFQDSRETRPQVFRIDLVFSREKYSFRHKCGEKEKKKQLIGFD
jgi:hypothetical protein